MVDAEDNTPLYARGRVLESRHQASGRLDWGARPRGLLVTLRYFSWLEVVAPNFVGRPNLSHTKEAWQHSPKNPMIATLSSLILFQQPDRVRQVPLSFPGVPPPPPSQRSQLT